MSQIKTKFIAANAVTYAKMQTETASTLLGNPTGGSAVPSEITLGTNLSFSGSVLNATGGGGSTSRTDVNTSTTPINALTVSASLIRLTGSTTCTINGITAGTSAQLVTVYNESTAVVTFTNQSGSASSGNKILTPNGGSFTLRPGGSISFIYDDSQTFWILQQALATQGVATNSAANAGEVGETISSFVSGLNGSTSVAQGAVISLTPGDWEVRATVSNSGSSQQYIVIGFNSSTASLSGNTNGLDKNFFNMQDTAGVGGAMLSNAYRMSSTQNLYLNYFTQASDGSGAFSVNLFARRCR